MISKENLFTKLPGFIYGINQAGVQGGLNTKYFGGNENTIIRLIQMGFNPEPPQTKPYPPQPST